jgi:hypothetical protein
LTAWLTPQRRCCCSRYVCCVMNFFCCDILCTEPAFAYYSWFHSLMLGAMKPES